MSVDSSCPAGAVKPISDQARRHCARRLLGVHVEGDLLTRLDLATICRLMKDRGIDALGTVTPGFGWLETGLDTGA